MADFSIEDIVLLIHGEIATAVTSAEAHGSSPGIKLSNVRVRMGQNGLRNEEGTISLNTERFPPAEKGWLIDISYSPTNQTSQESITDKSHILPSQVSQFLATTAVDKLSGVGKSYQLVLNQLDIITIQDLAELTRDSITPDSKACITQSQLRRFQSLAHLALSVPATSIPTSVTTIKLVELLDILWSNSNDIRLSEFTESSKDQILRWLQQLEHCLDNDFFNHLTLHKMLHEF